MWPTRTYVYRENTTRISCRAHYSASASQCKSIASHTWNMRVGSTWLCNVSSIYFSFVSRYVCIHVRCIMHTAGWWETCALQEGPLTRNTLFFSWHLMPEKFNLPASIIAPPSLCKLWTTELSVANTAWNRCLKRCRGNAHTVWAAVGEFAQRDIISQEYVLLSALHNMYVLGKLIYYNLCVCVWLECIVCS